MQFIENIKWNRKLNNQVSAMSANLSYLHYTDA